MRKLLSSLPILLALCGLCAQARGQPAGPRPEFHTPDRRYEFTSLAFKLRGVKRVTSRTPGWTAAVGEFFRLSEEMLRYGSAGDFERLAEDENPVVRVMGLVCLARADPEKSAAVLPLHFGDQAVVDVSHNCVTYETTVGRLARRLLSEPNFLGHESGPAAGPQAIRR
jgi:hypothetical protein